MEKLAKWGLCDPSTSMQKYTQVQTNQHDYFTEDRGLATISAADAKQFEIWLRTEPQNRGIPYATATCVRRIGCIKHIFKYGVEVGMISASPMATFRGGEAVNPSRWRYVSVDDCVRGILPSPI